MHDILLTCPPMIGMADVFAKDFSEAGFSVTIPEFTQEMSESALCEIIGNFDGWIIGDDPASRKVLEAGTQGKLKACMRWGVGTNNVDFEAFEEFQIPIENTPGVFGREVGDLATHYVTALARDTYSIDRAAKSGGWFKPIGDSLWSLNAVIVGMGDIGQNVGKRLAAHDMTISYVDPFVEPESLSYSAKRVDWPGCLQNADFVIFTAPLNDDTHHMFNESTLSSVKPGLKVVNVGRGPLIKEQALIDALRSGLVHSAALDVFEIEPISLDRHAELLTFRDRLILGSHNGSNTRQAVEHVSRICIAKLRQFLEA